MADDPQAAVPSAAGGAPDSDAQLIPVRYTGAQGLIVNGEGIGPGDIVHLPPDEVALWPDPHPYYERADQGAAGTPRAAWGGGPGAEDESTPAAAPESAPRKARAAAVASEGEAAVPASEPAAAPQG